MNKQIKNFGEFGLIRHLARLIKTDTSVLQGINDDAAVLKYTKDKYLLFTTDMLIEDVHFTRIMPAAQIGYKALAVNLSDIAAMGGVGRHAVISLGLPGDLKINFANEIYQGITRLAEKFKINIVGGDTNHSEKIIINISLLGEVEKKFLVLRNGAKAGDLIFTTGALGNSFKSGRHLNFMPRIEFARQLVKQCKPTAMIDISDGLVLDLSHILELSGKGALIYEQLIPRQVNASLQQALYEGEDFELLFTMSRSRVGLMLDKFRVYFIGEITAGRNRILMVDRSNKIKQLTPKGFRHF